MSRLAPVSGSSAEGTSALQASGKCGLQAVQPLPEAQRHPCVLPGQPSSQMLPTGCPQPRPEMPSRPAAPTKSPCSLATQDGFCFPGPPAPSTHTGASWQLVSANVAEWLLGTLKETN